MTDDKRARVLFLCTKNSCRSQMAEGWARSLFPDTIDACSAGVDPGEVNRLAIAAMREVGIDISQHRSKTIDACHPETIDLVVTVCSHAHETCPLFPGQARVIHRGFDDPPALAATARSDDEALIHYRRVRDEIKAFVKTLPTLLKTDRSEPATKGRP